LPAPAEPRVEREIEPVLGPRIGAAREPGADGVDQQRLGPQVGAIPDAGQRENLLDQLVVEVRDPDLEAMGHAENVCVSQQGVSHVGRELEPGDPVDKVITMHAGLQPLDERPWKATDWVTSVGE